MGFNAYEKAIQQYVCSHCIDFGEDGICHSPAPQGCAVYRFLPQLIDIASKIHEAKVEKYLPFVREEVCTYCRNRHLGENCPLRESLNCALDRYLPLILDALEHVPAEKKKRAS